MFVSLGAWFAFVGVALGAFGAHALKDQISPAALEIWHTGVLYHLFHALALILVGVISPHVDSKLIQTSGKLFAAGIVIFGGSLYGLALTNVTVKWLGAITPLGGVCFLTGWACLALGSRKA